MAEDIVNNGIFVAGDTFFGFLSHTQPRSFLKTIPVSVLPVRRLTPIIAASKKSISNATGVARSKQRQPQPTPQCAGMTRAGEMLEIDRVWELG